MANMWRGPTASLKAAEANPLWAALHRRNSKLGVFCNTSNDGLTASFYAVIRSKGEWYQRDLGQANGADPMLACLHGSRLFTPFDGDLIRLYHSYLESLAEDIVLDGYSVVNKLSSAVEQFCE